MAIADNDVRELAFETSVGSNFKVFVSINFETDLPEYRFVLEGGANVIFSDADLQQLNAEVLPLVQQAYNEDAILQAAADAAEQYMAGNTPS